MRIDDELRDFPHDGGDHTRPKNVTEATISYDVREGGQTKAGVRLNPGLSGLSAKTFVRWGIRDVLYSHAFQDFQILPLWQFLAAVPPAVNVDVCAGPVRLDSPAPIPQIAKRATEFASEWHSVRVRANGSTSDPVWRERAQRHAT